MWYRIVYAILSLLLQNSCSLPQAPLLMSGFTILEYGIYTAHTDRKKEKCLIQTKTSHSTKNVSFNQKCLIQPKMSHSTKNVFCIAFNKNNKFQHDLWHFVIKGILWNRRWIAPSIGIFSHTCWFFREMHLVIMKLNNPPSFRAIRALIASQSTFEI